MTATAATATAAATDKQKVPLVPACWNEGIFYGVHVRSALRRGQALLLSGLDVAVMAGAAAAMVAATAMIAAAAATVPGALTAAAAATPGAAGILVGFPIMIVAGAAAAVGAAATAVADVAAFVVLLFTGIADGIAAGICYKIREINIVVPVGRTTAAAAAAVGRIRLIRIAGHKNTSIKKCRGSIASTTFYALRSRCVTANCRR